MNSRSPALRLLVATSGLLLAVRLHAAARVGFGDSEALYAAYALHPQPAYLDHPGLIGLVARLLGGGTAPEPSHAHVVTAVLATLVPWLMACACRASGATWARSWTAALVFAVVPEIAVGLFAMTPDLLLALAWTASLACAAGALRSRPGSTRALALFAAAGLLAGIATTAKVTGLCLTGALAVTYASRPARPHARSLGPWAGLAAGALTVLPIVAYEAHTGWPMLVHRLIATQHGAGLSWRNASALVGGQALYLSPIIAALAVLAARDAWLERGDAVGTLLFSAFAIPLAVLVPLCLWSRVAEPHWPAPALLALVPAAARSRRSFRVGWVAASCGVGAAFVAAVYAWVLVPSLVRLAPASYDPKVDIANELYGWPDAIRAVREEVVEYGGVGGAPAGDPARAVPDKGVVVAGPHWVICAQLDAALRGLAPVGCDGPEVDDFDGWMPRDRWKRAPVVVWVTDARFPDSIALPDHAVRVVRRVFVRRGGRPARVFTISVLARSAAARATSAAPTPRNDVKTTS